MNFKGQWKSNHPTAEIEIQESRIFGNTPIVWVGTVKIMGLIIFTMWDKQGYHFSDPKLDLVQRLDDNSDPPIGNIGLHQPK